MRNLIKNLAVFAFVVLVVGCGYQPVSKITSQIMSKSVYVDVLMSKTDPQNTVAIKDAIKSGIVARLGSNLADKSSAQTYIVASIKRLTFTALTYDRYGYITSYRANLTLNFKTKLKNGEIFSKDCVGDHDFSVSRLVKNKHDTISVISDKERYDAIENASTQAFDEFISALAIKGIQLERAKN